MVSSVFDVRNLDGRNGFSVSGFGAAVGANQIVVGAIVASVGDLNGDGVNDMAHGNMVLGNVVAAFSARVIFGSSGPQYGGTNGVGITGQVVAAHSQVLKSVFVTPLKDMNADGADEVFFGWGDTGYVINGGYEPWITNKFSIPQGGSLQLNSSHIAVNPLLPESVFTASNISHGHFALTSNTSEILTQFTQGQITDGNVTAFHDGSNVSMGYSLSASSITRVFADPPLSEGNVSLVTNFTASPTAFPTEVPTAVPTMIPSVLPTALPTAIPTMIPSVMSPTAIPTIVNSSSSLLNATRNATEAATECICNSEEVSSSDVSPEVVVAIVALVAIMMFVVGAYYGCRKQRQSQTFTDFTKNALQGSQGATTAMIQNPMHASVVGSDEYLDVTGACANSSVNDASSEVLPPVPASAADGGGHQYSVFQAQVPSSSGEGDHQDLDEGGYVANSPLPGSANRHRLMAGAIAQRRGGADTLDANTAPPLPARVA